MSNPEEILNSGITEQGHSRTMQVLGALGATAALIVGGIVYESAPASAESTSVTTSCDTDHTVLVNASLTNDLTFTLTDFSSIGGGRGAGPVDVAPGETKTITIDLDTPTTPGDDITLSYSAPNGDTIVQDTQFAAEDCTEVPTTTTTTTVPTTTSTTSTTTPETSSTTTSTTVPETTTSTTSPETTTSTTSTTIDAETTTTTLEPNTTTTTKPGETTTTSEVVPPTDVPTPPVVEPAPAVPAQPVPAAPKPAPASPNAFEFAHTL